MSTKLERYLDYIQKADAFFFIITRNAVNSFLGPHPVFSVDLSAKKVSRTINWIGFSAEVTHSTRKEYEPHGAN